MPLPAWAIESIRAQASWVGKRYYPADEDRERHEERKALLKLVGEFPGREAKPSQSEQMAGKYEVVQQMPGGRSVMTWVSANDAEEAMRKSGLTYFTAEQLAAL